MVISLGLLCNWLLWNGVLVCPKISVAETRMWHARKEQIRMS